MVERARVAVLASGGGSNFQALVDRFGSESAADADAPASIVGLVASRESAGVLDRARRAGVPSAVLPPDARPGAARETEFLLDTLAAWRPGLVVLAGYMRLVPEPVVAAYRGRMINIHPALLPSFGGEGMYGGRVHRAVIAAGVRVTGVTVHFVDEAYDRGPILCQWPVPVLAGDAPDRVAARVLEVEHALLPAAVEALARAEAELGDDGRVRWTREWFGGERFHTSENSMEREG